MLGLGEVLFCSTEQTPNEITVFLAMLKVQTKETCVGFLLTHFLPLLVSFYTP